MTTVPTSAEPVRIALIGAGNRAQTEYAPLISSLRPWAQLVVVCDPVKANCDALAARLGVPAVYDIRKLVTEVKPEAALIVTPVESHHSISIYLSSHGIHNMTETTWASTVLQTKDMIATARRHNVIVRVGENFYRFPPDRFAQTLKTSGYLGRIGRIFSYADHTGYHNNSRWIRFAGAHPQWVQCLEHSMAHPAFYSMPQRRHTEENLNARFFGFADGFLVMDTGSGHVKGHLGRHPRPGYTEWQGERGTLMYRAGGHEWGSDLDFELRYCSDAKFAAQQEASGQLTGGGLADQVTPVVMEMDGAHWVRSYANTPSGVIEYVNPYRPLDTGARPYDWYGAAIMGHIVDFVLAACGLRASEFSAEDALMSEMMEVGARESALNEGKRIRLPVEGDLETDALTLAALRKRYGVDPLDVEAMLAISYPRP